MSTTHTIQKAGVSKYGTDAIRIVYKKPSQKVWDIMLAVVEERSYLEIAEQFNVSTAYVSSVAAMYGIRSRRCFRSHVARTADGHFLVIDDTRFSIDSDAAAWVQSFSWQVDRNGYAVCGQHGLLHRCLVKAEKGQIVDHIDGDKTNNKRENLRIVDARASARNRRRSARAPTIFKGISRKRDGLWVAMITVDNKPEYLGTFASPINAAHAYDARCRELFGCEGRYNFPESGEQSALYLEDALELERLICRFDR